MTTQTTIFEFYPLYNIGNIGPVGYQFADGRIMTVEEFRTWVDNIKKTVSIPQPIPFSSNKID